MKDADLVVIATPVGTNGAIAKAIAPHLKPGAIVTDVGSVKQAVIAAIMPHIPKGVDFVPGHPLAGTEHSGPEAGFAELFENRWTMLDAAAAHLRQSRKKGRRDVAGDGRQGGHHAARPS